MLIFSIILFVLAAVAAVSGLCYRMAFHVPPRKPMPEDHIPLPEGPVYEPLHPRMREWVRQIRAMPRERCEITSFDGLRLTGMYYEYKPGAPMEIMFHGYRGSAERDLPGGVQRAFDCGHSVLIVDQRCAGGSQGKTITFGIHERRDCLAWVDFARKRFGSGVKIILTGISMGAATVIMAGGEELPDNVIGILADCGYSSAREIMEKIIGQMGLPPKLCFPFVKLGARLFGGFDLEETSPMDALTRVKVPVIFFHGQQDDFVPCWMSEKLYRACPTRKKLYLVPGADHGLSYPMDMDGYIRAVREFFGSDTAVQ